MSVSAARHRAPIAVIAATVMFVGLSVTALPGRASGTIASTAHAARPAARSSARCPAAYPLRKVHAGLRGTGFTTVKGTTPTPFSVRVLGVLHDGIAPGIDMIVIATHSRTIKHHGTWEGMSGSPIYARDGRLIGALSYGLSFGATNKAGVTPAAAMYQLLNDRRAPAATYAKHVAVPRSMAGGGDASAAGEQSSADLRLLPTPITVSGVPAAGMSMVRKQLREAGAAPFSLHTGGATGVSHRGSAAKIRPGAPFAVTYVYGDYTIGGVGTVTAVCGRKVLAFGHPMMELGATTETANTARVLYVQRDPTGPSFVMANIGPIVGTLDQDRLPGVRATLGRAPSATRITTHAFATATGLRRTGVSHTPVVDEVADAAGGSTYFNLLTTAQTEGAGSASYAFTATGRTKSGKRWTLHRSDVVTDPYDVEFQTAMEIDNLLGAVVGNPFDALSVSNVKVHATVTERRLAEWELSGLSVNDGSGWEDVTPSTAVDVAPGDTLQLRAHLSAYRNSQKKRTVDLAVHVPAAAGPGPAQLQVTGGEDLAEQFPDTSTATDLAGVMKLVNSIPHGNDVVAQLSYQDFSGTAVTKTHHVRIDDAVRGAGSIQLNVVVPCGADCDGDGGGDGGEPTPASGTASYRLR
ncbi:MAG TPA: hypothetical protein VG650_14160 [Mycobacteriales bacterium]|nr:hypothetical protein [Mycobacteriales bacterium]